MLVFLGYLHEFYILNHHVRISYKIHHAFLGIAYGRTNIKRSFQNYDVRENLIIHKTSPSIIQFQDYPFTQITAFPRVVHAILVTDAK